MPSLDNVHLALAKIRFQQLPYSLIVFGKIGLSKQCKPRSDAAYYGILLSSSSFRRISRQGVFFFNVWTSVVRSLCLPIFAISGIAVVYYRVFKSSERVRFDQTTVLTHSVWTDSLIRVYTVCHPSNTARHIHR